MDTRHRKILLDHLPDQSLDRVISWLEQYRVSLRITRKRNTKTGDYRPPLKAAHHRISVNGDLHPWAFLVTLVHELAHLVTWEKYQRKVSPHGTQWKDQFRFMLGELEVDGIFSPEMAEIVQAFISGKISYRKFNRRFDEMIHETAPGTNESLLENIPVNSLFSIHNGRTFVKMEKLRTRYRCRDIRTGRYYLVSGMARVVLRSDAG